jgi:hypothetical protein
MPIFGTQKTHIFSIEPNKQLMKSKYNNSILQYSALVFGLSTLSLFFLPTELYGTTISCDPSNLTDCDDDEKISSSLSSNSAAAGDDTQSDNTEVPLVLPDISPTDQDLSAPTTDTDLDASDTDSGNNNANRDDSENSADSDDTNRDNEQENDDEDSENNEESSSGDDGRTLLPFP